jgi:hypothetical protein
MGQIITLPKNRKRTATQQRVDGLLLDKLPKLEQYAHINKCQFTCATCKNITKFDFSGMVLKDCSFYCSSCGTGYKVENPIFSKGIITKYNE